MKYSLLIPRCLILANLLLLSSLISNVIAQNSDEAQEVTSKYLLKNVNIISQPGTISFGSILINDGLIEQIGQNITTPYDAQIIDLDSMYVYAGFIDALSHAGLVKKEEERPSIRDTGNPPNAVAGITPEKSIYEEYIPKESSVVKMREQGFGIVHVVPNGRMMPGMGSIFLLGEGDGAEQLIRKDASMFSQLKSANRVAPATTIGVMAKYRDIYRNAEEVDKYAKKYKSNPVGKRRLEAEPAVEAFIPVVNRQLPIFFVANKGLDVSRVIALQNELGFNLVLCDVKQGWTMTEKIKTGDYPLLLSLDLPDAIKEDKKAKKDDSKMTSEEKKELEEKQNKKNEEEAKAESKLSILERENKKAKIAREERKKKSIKEYESQAATMEQQGIKFAFTGISTRPNKVHKNLTRMVEAGLSETAALAALTTNAADILGISDIVGTIEKGKIANLVVTDAPYFEEKSKIKYVFVDGKMSKYDKKDESKSQLSKGAVAKLAGDWKYSIEIPGETQGGIIRISADGEDLLIEVSSNDSPDEFETANSISFKEQNLLFDLSVDNNGFKMDLSFDLEVDENTMKGKVKAGDFGYFPIEASRDPN